MPVLMALLRQRSLHHAHRVARAAPPFDELVLQRVRKRVADLPLDLATWLGAVLDEPVDRVRERDVGRHRIAIPELGPDQAALAEQILATVPVQPVPGP